MNKKNKKICIREEKEQDIKYNIEEQEMSIYSIMYCVDVLGMQKSCEL